MNYHNRFLLLIFMFFLSQIHCQNHQDQSYKKISGLFNSYSENDERALVFVNLYISKAKKDSNLKKLIRGYEEAIYYSEDVNLKLLFADSAIITAKKYRNDDNISRAYLGKGIIYYYNRRHYKPALEQYLIAFKFSKNSKDDYLKNKITYHLGMVKSYLGYYREAAAHFETAADYFEEKSKENVHPNIRLNNESGYFNSIYRLSTCYRNLRLFHKEDSLINIGLQRIHDNDQLLTEYGYFQKGKGIQLFRLGNLRGALPYFKQSKDILSHHQDDASLMTVYFYLGKLYWSEGKKEESLKYLNKVDSLVNKFWFVTPEIRSAYEYLIKNAKENENYKQQLYYTNQLLKADSIINTDFAMLSSKIHREYDTNTLLEEKNKLQMIHKNGFIILYYSLGFGLMILCFSIWKFRKREKALTVKYQELLEKFNTSQSTDYFIESKSVSSEEKSIYSEEIIEEVKRNLKIFEQKEHFVKQNLTLPVVAKMIGSNRTHLSYVLNVHLDLTFTNYLKILRIKYITNLLLEDSKYLNFKIENLAEKCGMANRQIFSAHFLEINGIRPTDFIRKRQEEIKKK